MKVPDKLFLHPNYRGEVGASWLTFPLTEKDECYIRKDTLLEWAKDVKATLENQNVIKGDIRKGAVWELKEIIAKIESL